MTAPASAGRSAATEPGQRPGWLLACLGGANLLVFASVTIMNVALPAAGRDLGLSTSAAQGVVTLYSLSFGTLLLVGGRLADVIGLRRCLVTGLVGFAAASLLAGLAPTAEVLLAARVLQGAAGALVAATAVSLLSVSFPSGRPREVAFGVLGVVMGLGTAGSFLLGGVLVEWLSWRWCLLVNVPLALLVAWGVRRLAPPGARRAGARVDLVGAVLVTGSLAALVAGLDRATAWGWWHGGTLGLLTGGAVGLGLFALASARAEQPLVPPHLLASRDRVASYLAAMFGGVAMFAGMFVLTTFLMEVRGLSPIQAGWAFVPFGISAIGATWVLPAIRARMAPASVLAGGLVLAAVAIATLMLLRAESGYVVGVLPSMLLLGAAGTIVMITAGEVATSGAGADSGVAGSLVNATQQIGAALGTALLTSVMTVASRQQRAAGAAELDAIVSGHARAGLVGALLLLAAAVVVRSLRGRS